MGIDEEISQLPHIIDFEEDEELLAVQFGTVKGPGIDGREGILFVTQYRVGLSVAPGIFTGAAGWSIGLCGIKEVSHGKWGIKVKVIEQHGAGWLTRDLKVSTFGEGEYAQQVLQANLEVRQMLDYLSYRNPRIDLIPLVEQCEADLEAERYKSALDKATQIVNEQPGYLYGLWMKAVVTENVGDLASTLAAFRTMAELGPDDPGAIHAEMARVLWNMDQYDEAVEAATIAIKTNDAPDAYIWRGMAYASLEEKTAAVSDIKRAVQVAPESPFAWRILGMLASDLENTADLARAVEHMKRLGDEEQFLRACEAAWHRLAERHDQAYAIAGQYLDKDRTSSVVAIEFLQAACEVDTAGGIARLPSLDEIHGGDKKYELMASILLLHGGRATAAQERFSKLFEANPLEEAAALAAAFEAAALFEQGHFGDVCSVARPYLMRDDWIVDENLRGTQGWLAYYLGCSLQELGMSEESLPHLQLAESLSDEESLWTEAELQARIERAHREIGGGVVASTLEIEGEKFGTYEILGMVLAELERSGRMPALERRARQIYDRFDQPPLLAVMGEYSVGKSTFINAWIERDLLPTGEGVTTGTITWLRYGEQERMRVVMMDGRVRELPTLVSIDQAVRETGNDDEIWRIRHVEVFLDAPVLRLINIVDSPGLNAPFPEHQKLTEGFLELADGIFFLFNVEAAGKSTEARFLAKLQQHQRKAVGVVNQIDLVPLDEAVEVIEGIEVDFPDCFVKVMGVSGRLALDGALRDDPNLRARSRMPQMRSWLDENLLDQARQLKADAARTKVEELLGRVSQARAGFDEVASQDTQRVVDMRKGVVQWFKDELAAEVDGRLAKVKNHADSELQGLAIKIAQRSTAQGLLDPASINAMAQGFHRECVQAWKEYSEGLQQIYLERIAPIQRGLDEIESKEWKGILDATLAELRIEIESWRKDLADYIEQVENFSAGFIDAQGIASTLYLNTPQGSATDSAFIGQHLRGRMTFVTDRAQMAGERWCNELVGNFEGRLVRLERKMRMETARIRDEGYLRVERLASSL